MLIPATLSSLPRPPTMNSLELESYLIKLSWLLVPFILEWVFTLRFATQVTFPNLDFLA